MLGLFKQHWDVFLYVRCIKKMKFFPRPQACHQGAGAGPASRHSLLQAPRPISRRDVLRVLCVFLSSPTLAFPSYCLPCRIYKSTVAIQIHKFMQKIRITENEQKEPVAEDRRPV